MINPAADFPHVVQRSASVAVNQRFIGSAMGDAVCFWHLPSSVPVNRNGKAGYIDVVNLHADGFAADIDDLPLVERDMVIVTGGFFLLKQQAFFCSSILFRPDLIEARLFGEPLLFSLADKRLLLVGFFRRHDGRNCRLV